MLHYTTFEDRLETENALRDNFLSENRKTAQQRPFHCFQRGQKVCASRNRVANWVLSCRPGFTDLEPGSYVITEIAVPDGYILDMTPHIVELKPGESKQIEIYNTAKPGLQLRKIDKLTNLPVAKAVFSLVRLESGARLNTAPIPPA